MQSERFYRAWWRKEKRGNGTYHTSLLRFLVVFPPSLFFPRPCYYIPRFLSFPHQFLITRKVELMC